MQQQIFNLHILSLFLPFYLHVSTYFSDVIITYDTITIAFRCQRLSGDNFFQNRKIFAKSVYLKTNF